MSRLSSMQMKTRPAHAGPERARAAGYNDPQPAWLCTCDDRDSQHAQQDDQVRQPQVLVQPGVVALHVLGQPAASHGRLRRCMASGWPGAQMRGQGCAVAQQERAVGGGGRGRT